jgi:hypothetical protein
MKRLSVLQTLCRQDACVPDFKPPSLGKIAGTVYLKPAIFACKIQFLHKHNNLLHKHHNLLHKHHNLLQIPCKFLHKHNKLLQIS